jgi:hypothetical protein
MFELSDSGPLCVMPSCCRVLLSHLSPVVIDRVDEVDGTVVVAAHPRARGSRCRRCNRVSTRVGAQPLPTAPGGSARLGPAGRGDVDGTPLLRPHRLQCTYFGRRRSASPRVSACRHFDTPPGTSCPSWSRRGPGSTAGDGFDGPMTMTDLASNSRSPIRPTSLGVNPVWTRVHPRCVHPTGSSNALTRPFTPRLRPPDQGRFTGGDQIRPARTPPGTRDTPGTPVGHWCPWSRRPARTVACGSSARRFACPG